MLAPSLRHALTAIALSLGVLGLATIETAPLSAQSRSPQAMCGRGDWLRLPGPADGSHVYALAATSGRLYAAGRASTAEGDYASWSMALDAAVLQRLGSPMNGRRLTDLLVTPGDPTTLAWAAGFGDDRIYTASPEAPTAFSPRGSLDAWPMQLLAAGGQTYAAFARPGGGSGVYRWDGSAWLLAGGANIESSDTSRLAFWSSARGNGRLWLGTERRGLWSADEADAAVWSWAGEDALLKASTVTAVAVDPLLPGRMAAGLGPNLDGSIDHRGLRRSSDGGSSWSEPDFVAQSPLGGPELISALSYSQVLSGTLVAAVYGHGLQVSRDAGARWQRLLPPSDPAAHENFLSALTTARPESEPGCELLFAAGQAGVWVRDLSTLPGEQQIYLPYANLGRSDDFPELAGAGPTPVAPRLVAPGLLAPPR